MIQQKKPGITPGLQFKITNSKLKIGLRFYFRDLCFDVVSIHLCNISN